MPLLAWTACGSTPDAADETSGLGEAPADAGTDARARLCQPDALRCTLAYGTAARDRCASDGMKWIHELCPEGNVCGGEGDCKPPVCAAGAKRCDPDLTVCAPDRLGWVAKPCAAGTQCKVLDGSAACEALPKICQPGAAKCEPDRFVCAPDGLAWSPSPCPNDTACVPTTGSASCVQKLCVPGATGCSNDGTALLTCAADGMSWTSTSCASGAACTSGQCAPTPLGNGEVVVMDADAPAALPPGAYALAVVDTDSTADDTVAFPVAVTGIVGDAITAAPSIGLAPMPKAPWCGSSRIAMPPLATSASRSAPRLQVPPLAAAPAVGDHRVFHVPDEVTPTSTDRTAVLRSIGARAYFWEDVTDGPAGSLVDDTTLSELADRIDGGVYPRDEAIFGAPTDVDGNGHIDVFFTTQVGKHSSSLAFVYGSVTLVPPGTYAGSWDHGEVVYAGVHNSPPGEVAGILAHELQHLIYEGQQYTPWLEGTGPFPAPRHVYPGEGAAELARAWSGQSGPGNNAFALYAIDLWSLSRFSQVAYSTDTAANAAAYGMSAFVFEYLFDQAGAVSIQGKGAVTDLGGAAFARAFDVAPPSQPAPLDGRPLETWYVDFAAAMLLTSLDPAALAPATSSRAEWSLVTPTTDAWWGGPLSSAPGKGGVASVALAPWSTRPVAFRRGGLGFYAMHVGTGGATLSVGRGTTHVVAVRHL